MTNPVRNGVDDEDATSPETKGRVFVNEQQRKSNLWSARKLFYDLYVAEMRQIMCEVRDSFDVSRLDQSFCSTCNVGVHESRSLMGRIMVGAEYATLFPVRTTLPCLDNDECAGLIAMLLVGFPCHPDCGTPVLSQPVPLRQRRCA